MVTKDLPRSTPIDGLYIIISFDDVIFLAHSKDSKSIPDIVLTLVFALTVV